MVDNGDGPRPTSPSEVVQGWQATLSPLDAVYHQVNQYIITLTVRKRRRACMYVCVPGFRSLTSERAGRDPASACHLVTSCRAPRARGWMCIAACVYAHTHTCAPSRPRYVCPYNPRQHNHDRFATGPEHGAGDGLRLGDALQGRCHSGQDADVRGPLQLRAGVHHHERTSARHILYWVVVWPRWLGDGSLCGLTRRASRVGDVTPALWTYSLDAPVCLRRQGWRIRGLKFTLKFMDGNLTLL